MRIPDNKKSFLSLIKSKPGNHSCMMNELADGCEQSASRIILAAHVSI